MYVKRQTRWGRLQKKIVWFNTEWYEVGGYNSKDDKGDQVKCKWATSLAGTK